MKHLPGIKQNAQYRTQKRLVYLLIIVNLSTNIHNESVQTEYIPSYISENGVKLFINLKLMDFF